MRKMLTKRWLYVMRRTTRHIGKFGGVKVRKLSIASSHILFNVSETLVVCVMSLSRQPKAHQSIQHAMLFNV